MNSLNYFFKLIGRELKFTFLKDPRRFMLLFWAATIYLLLFGLLYQQGVINHIPTVIYDQNNSAMSRQLIEDIDNSQRFDVKYFAQNQEDLEYFLKTHHDWVAFQIPPNFNRNVKLGHSSNVMMFIDGSNIVMTSMSSIAGIEIIKSFSDEQAQKLLQQYASQTVQRASFESHPIHVSYRVIGNTTLSYFLFFTLGLALAAFQQGVLLSIAGSFLFKKQKISPYEEDMNPLSRVLAKILPYWVISLLGASLLMGTANYVLGIPMAHASFWTLLLLLGSFSLALCGIGSLLCCFIRSELSFTRVSVCYTVPAFILTGFTWPIAGFSPATKILAYISPMTYVANNFRNYYLNGYDPNIYKYSLILSLVGIITLIGSMYFYNKIVKKHFAEKYKAELERRPL